MTLGGHVVLARTTRRQCRDSAMKSSAGNHCVACESPKSAIVVVPCGSPYTHGETVATVYVSLQPSTNGAALSPCASTSAGDRFDGISLVATPEETASATDAWSTESCDDGEVVVGAAAAVGADEFESGAAPCSASARAGRLPVRRGSDALTTNVHTSANAVSRAPTASDRPARRDKRGE